MGLCYWLGGKWVIESVWKEEEIESMAKVVGGREVIEMWEANAIAILEMLLSSPGIMLASCLLPLVFSFKLMFRRSRQNLAQHLMIPTVLSGIGPCFDISAQHVLDRSRISK